MKLRAAPLTIIFITLVIDVIGIGLVFPIVPKLVEDITGGNIVAAASIYGWLVASYSLMQFAFGPIMGALSDRFGRRPIILISLFGLALDYLILTFATTLWALLAARIVGGMLSASFTTANAYIADISPPERRAQNFGLMGVALGVGFIAGPFLGGVLGEYWLRLPFVAGMVLSLADAVLAYFLLPELLIEKNRRRFRLREANPVGALMVVTQYPAITALVLCLVFSNLAERMLESVWVLYTGYRYGWGPAAVGFSLAAFGALFAISQGVLVRLVVPWLGEWRTIIGGLAIAALELLPLRLCERRLDGLRHPRRPHPRLVARRSGDPGGRHPRGSRQRAGAVAGRLHQHCDRHGDHRRTAGGRAVRLFRRTQRAVRLPRRALRARRHPLPDQSGAHGPRPRRGNETGLGKLRNRIICRSRTESGAGKQWPGSVSPRSRWRTSMRRRPPRLGKA